MLRKRLSRWSTRSDGSHKPHCAFSEAFWQYYVTSLNTDSTGGFRDLTKPNLAKYGAASSAVTLVKSYFAADQPQPSVAQIAAALKSPFSQGDPVKAYYWIRFFQLSDQGYFITNDGHDRAGSAIQLRGAENWEHVMCYLDALLFSMFANLESFEPILFLSNTHPDPQVAQLSGLLRVYVNMMRSGNLITTDLTQKICESLWKLGFAEALSHKQQDCAPLFEFLTQTLSMPLLTFRVEIQHSGKSDSDDTKYAKERILFVSLPDDGPGDEPVLLEECLEHYFNNSISVKRELQRRATLEQQERVSVGTNSAAVSVSSSPTPAHPQARPRASTLSIWSLASAESKPREVMLPAWMLLRLMPFYTDDNQVVREQAESSESIARNTREFANRRPVLPICLKRYSFSTENNASRRSHRRIVIPPVIDLPPFLADDACDPRDNTASFKLILESAVCHRGTTIESGHFVSAVRKNTNIVDESLEQALDASWYLYDDISASRVVTKSFKDIFDSEWPYMLFYRLVPSDSLAAASPGFPSARSGAASPVVAPKGHKAKYWSDDVLSPILSCGEDTGQSRASSETTTTEFASSATEVASSEPTEPTSSVGLAVPELAVGDKLAITRALSSAKSHDSFANFPSASVPLPSTPPTHPNYVDIRKRYLWYVTDKDKNYYKESASLSRSGSGSVSISFTPQFRRNSQWSLNSNISGLSLNGDGVSTTRSKSERDSSPELTEKKETPKKSEASGKSSLEQPKLPEPKDGAKSPGQKAKEHRHRHHLFSHDKEKEKEKEKENHSSLTKQHVRKKHADYKKEKCVIT